MLDEPTAALSRNEIDILLAQLRRLRERGVACVFISHKLDEVFAIADRITVLRDGVRAGHARCRGTDADEVIRRMVGRRIEDHYPRRQSTPGRTLLAVRGVDVDPPPTGGVALRGIELRSPGRRSARHRRPDGRGTHRAAAAPDGTLGRAPRRDGRARRPGVRPRAIRERRWHAGLPSSPRTASATDWCCRRASRSTCRCRRCAACGAVRSSTATPRWRAPGRSSTTCGSRRRRSSSRSARCPAATSRRWCSARCC